MSDFSINMDAKELFEAMARLKGIPIEKVVRNASRDFARAGKKATPQAIISKSPYYKFFDERDGKWHFLHETQVEEEYINRKGISKKRVSKKAKNAFGQLRKVRIAKNWSKYSWNGVFAALGMSDEIRSVPARMQKVNQIGNAFVSSSQEEASVTIEDYIHFDRFGTGSDFTSSRILQAGYERAATNMTKEVDRMLRKHWGGI